MIRTKGGTIVGGSNFWGADTTFIGSGVKVFNPMDLFKNNEQGFFYDPNDLSTMFQDAAGTVPVTDVGQPVGLILDKSKGLALSSELKQSALAKMTGTAPVATFNTVTGVGTVNRIDIANQSFIVFNDTTGKKWYKVSITNNGAVSISLRNASMVGVDATLTTIAPNTTFNGYVYVSLGFLLGIAASIGDCSFTVNSIKQLTGNHAYQTTSASRPILRQNAETGAYYLEFDGSDDFLQTSNIDFTATDKLSLFAGVRKLSDAATSMLMELSTSADTNPNSFYLAAPLTTSSFRFYTKGNSATAMAVAVPLNVASAPFSCVAIVKSAMVNDGDVSVKINQNTYTAKNTAAIGNYGNYPLFIGRRGGASFPFNGHIYSLIGIGKLTTDNETAGIEKELAKRVGVTLNV